MERSGQVCVIGGANVDIEGRSVGPFIARDSNAGTVTRAPGGVARNIAENLARLGVSVRLLSAVGDDEAGAWLLAETASCGVDVDRVLTCAGRSTATYVSIIDDAGELVAAINDMAVLDTLDASAIAAAQPVIETADAVVVDCNLSPSALTALVECASGTPVFVDPVSSGKAPRIEPLLGRLHLLKPNAAEAALLAGVGANDPDAAMTAAQTLVGAGVRQLVVSLGHAGVVYASPDGAGLVRPPPSPIVSVTGAGDALMAGLVWAQLEGADLETSVRLATGAAAVAARSPRTVSEDMSPETVRAAAHQTTGEGP